MEIKFTCRRNPKMKGQTYDPFFLVTGMLSELDKAIRQNNSIDHHLKYSGKIPGNFEPGT